MRRVGIIGLMFLATPCWGQVFVGLGRVGASNSSIPLGLSGDGTAVVGRTTGFDTAWRWTQSTGLVPFSGAPAGLSLDAASDVSLDGSTVVGSMNDGNLTYAWRWTQATGVQRVVGVGGGATFGPFVSADGSTIVGTGEGLSIGPAVRWTQATGVQSLNPVTGLPLGNGGALLARGVSADGSVVVGTGSALYLNAPPTSTFVPFRWTQSAGSVGMLNNGQFYFPQIGAGASDTSADGSVVVGYVGAGVWRWTANSGFSLILNPPATPGTFLPHTSGDGTTVVYRHLFWTETAGEVPLTTVLTTAGCNFSGWNSIFATGIDFDGNTLCGYGTSPTGQTEAWYATIPAPGVGGVIALALMGSVRRTRRA